MHVIVGENSILTHLAQQRVLERALQLPRALVVPDVMLADPLLDLGGYGRSALVDMGAFVGRLDGGGVERARSHQVRYPELCTTEAFALVLAETAGGGAIMLAAEPLLCRTVRSHGVEVHGLCWIMDELHRSVASGIAQRRSASPRPAGTTRSAPRHETKTAEQAGSSFHEPSKPMGREPAASGAKRKVAW